MTNSQEEKQWEVKTCECKLSEGKLCNAYPLCMAKPLKKMTSFKKFALESNQIEGESLVTEDQIEATKIAYELGNALNLEDILNLHKKCFKKEWAGKWRTCHVWVGRHTPPPPEEVPELMKEWYSNWDRMDAWEAHNSFEFLYPFQDGNGRLGRLIWLAKMEGWDFQRTFLHFYYYQTLNHLNF